MKVIDKKVLRVLEKDDDHNIWAPEIRRNRMI
jgi:hypothetical protein